MNSRNTSESYDLLKGDIDHVEYKLCDSAISDSMKEFYERWLDELAEEEERLIELDRAIDDESKCRSFNCATVEDCYDDRDPY